MVYVAFCLHFAWESVANVLQNDDMAACACQKVRQAPCLLTNVKVNIVFGINVSLIPLFDAQYDCVETQLLPNVCGL